MPDTAHFDELLHRLRDAQERGEPLTPDALCTDRPDLLPELRRRWDMEQHINGLVEPAGPETFSTQVSPVPELPLELQRLLTPPQRPDEVGRLGGYRVLRLVGQGGMGAVFEGYDDRLHRRVAIKVMLPEVAGRLGFRERFLSEARAAAGLDHPNIVPVYAVGEEKGTLFIAMKFLDGETLEARLKPDTPLPMADVLRLGRETAEGLAAAHAKGLIHRDIKPLNLWLEAAAGDPSAVPHVRILDFGLSRSTNEGAPTMTPTGSLMGTVGYIAPEQIDGVSIDARADLFSLGCVLYRCATGKPPFEGATLTAVLRATAERHPPPARDLNPMVPQSLSDLIGRLMAKAPAGRPASARAVADELTWIESGSRTRTGYYPGPQPRRGWRRVAVAAGLAAVVLAGVIVALRPGKEPSSVASDGGGGGVVPAAIQLKVDLRINKTRESPPLRLTDPQALPLRAGEYVSLQVEANRAAYLYAVYIDAAGVASPAYPWRKYDWSDRPAEEKRDHLTVPENAEQGEPLGNGPSGMETYLVLARDEPLTAEENAKLQELFRKFPKQEKVNPLAGVVWLAMAEPRQFGNERDRARPDQEKPGDVTDPVGAVERLLREPLRKLAGDAKAVCYPFRGE